VLWALTGGFASVALLLLGITLGIHRSYARPGFPQRRMDLDPGAVACPACGGKMAEGYLPVLAGVHWREPGAPVGLPNALSGLPGTVGWRRRPLVHAFRCGTCEIISFQYGRSMPT